MLLQIGTANHRSIRSFQELLLTASKRIKDDRLVIPVPTLNEAALPVVAIYGPNAAGKSNLVDAIDEMRRTIVESHASLGPTEPILRQPFLLDDSSEAAPTRFECTFTLPDRPEDDRNTDEGVYEYGFEFTNAKFCKEWLRRTIRKERQSTRTLFQRETQDGRIHVRFGTALRGENKTIANVTRPNSLFLSAAAQNNHPQLTRLYEYFKNDWKVIVEVNAADPSVANHIFDCKHMNFLVELVRQSDIGVEDIRVQNEKIDKKNADMARDMIEIISKQAQRRGGAISTDDLLDSMRGRKQIKFTHSAKEGLVRVFDYDLESKGTRTLISLLVPALRSLSDGSLLVIDELDTSLHPNLVRAFVSLFSKKEFNPNGAQLIFSTHDVTLLGAESIRQDEIWMTDKDSEGASTFTPLTDFKLRSRVDFEKAYRNGRFGGAPSTDEFIFCGNQEARRAKRNMSRGK